ncbi:hypothetical protein Tco_0698550, partial [Tanacetum coccineum]
FTACRVWTGINWTTNKLKDDCFIWDFLSSNKRVIWFCIKFWCADNPIFNVALHQVSYLFEHVGISTYADIFTYTDNPIFAYKSYEHENGYAFADVSTYADDLIFAEIALFTKGVQYADVSSCSAWSDIFMLPIYVMLNNVDLRIAINIDPNTPRNDTYKERYVPSKQNVMDLEDFGSNLKSPDVGPRRIVRSFETKCQTSGLGASSMDKPDQGGSHQLFHVL